MAHWTYRENAQMGLIRWGCRSRRMIDKDSFLSKISKQGSSFLGCTWYLGDKSQIAEEVAWFIRRLAYSCLRLIWNPFFWGLDRLLSCGEVCFKDCLVITKEVAYTVSRLFFDGFIWTIFRLKLH